MYAKFFSIECKSEDCNGKNLDKILTDTDLVVLNDDEPIYFSFSNFNYSETLDLVLCSKSLSVKNSDFIVLSNDNMGSDHAPVMCKIYKYKC